MSEKDEITGLFRSRLAGAEMTVRDGFWEKLQEDAAVSMVNRKKGLVLSPRYYRIVAAASVIFTLGAASAAFWYFSPKEEIKEAFTQVAAYTPEGNLDGDVVQEFFPSIHQVAPIVQNTSMGYPVKAVPAGMVMRSEDENESVSVRFSITIRQQQVGSGYFNGNDALQNGNPYYNIFSQGVSDIFSTVPTEEEPETASPICRKSSKWALKAVLGTSLPQGGYSMPLTAGVMVERVLNNRFALETGIQYNRLHANRTLHVVGIPVNLNMLVASTSKIDFYATVGGAAAKCVAGASDNGFTAEPVQLSVMAGVGMRYKLNDRFALFAEPSVSHHFDTDSETRTLRTERPTNLNLLCGVRMTY